MKSQEKDVLCQKILDTLNHLDDIISDSDSCAVFDIEKNAECYETHHELNRLRRSLEQYTEKSAALLYVGFLGHFSSGKSSTINSLLGTPDLHYQRLTGLHPTDKAVTLISHPKHSNDLIGTHRRGELEVGSSLVENSVLNQRVVVDTPGTGDPSVLEEMVRDFLPICDCLVYTFSAAIPLDRTDLPILEKAKRDLPFIPMVFLVTRADEFRQDPLRPLSKDNFDNSKSDMFVSELISRLATAIKGLSVTQDDVLIIDNLTNFNTEKLAGFVFPEIDSKKDLSSILHAHKIAYYGRSAKRIRDYFVNYLKCKIITLEKLLTTAENNHSHYQEAVTMANSRLTESWAEQDRALSAKLFGQTNWVKNLDTCIDLPTTLIESAPLAFGMTELQQTIGFWADSTAQTVCRSFKSKLSALVHSHMSSLYDKVFKSKEPDTIPFQPLIIDNPQKEGLFDFQVESPLAITTEIRKLPNQSIEFLRVCASTISENARRLSDSISDHRLVSSMERTLDESIQQVEEMLDAFFQSVQLYRSAILSLNARELAEKVGILQAIEEVERAEIPKDKRESWRAVTIERVFPKRKTLLEQCEKKLAEIQNSLYTVCNEANRLRTIKVAVNLGPNVEDIFALSQPGRDNQLLQAVQSAIDSFNEESSSLFQHLSTEREMLLNKRREILKKRIREFMTRRFRRLCIYASVGSLVGLMAYLAFYFWKKPFDQNWTTTFLVGALANAFITSLSWLIGRLTDRSKRDIEDVNSNHTAESREITRQLINDNRSISTWNFIDTLLPTIKAVLSRHWASAADTILKESVIEPCEKPYQRLTSIASTLERVRTEYLAAAEELALSFSGLYQRTDENLAALAEVSAKIREQAIEPSFSMLQNWSCTLTKKLDELEALDFSW